MATSDIAVIPYTGPLWTGSYDMLTSGTELKVRDKPFQLEPKSQISATTQLGILCLSRETQLLLRRREPNCDSGATA